MFSSAWIIAFALGGVALAVFGLPIVARILGVGPAPPPGSGTLLELSSGHEIDYFDSGGAGVPIVLVHGMPGSAHDWGSFPATLVAAGFRVIRYDRVGYGHSSRRSRGTEGWLDENSSELRAIVKALELETPVLLGWSYGAAIVQSAIVESTSWVRASISVATYDGSQSEPAPWLPTFVEAWGLRTGFLARPEIRRGSDRAFDGRAPRSWVEQTLSMLALPGSIASLRSEEMESVDVAFERMRTPSLLIHGTRDGICDPEISRRIAVRAESATLVEIEGGGHMLPLTHSAELVSLVVDFLERERMH